MCTMNTGSLLRKHRQSSGLSVRDAAVKLRIAASTLRSLENGSRRFTAEMALAIERATNGEVTRHELRPDLWPDEPATSRRRPAKKARRHDGK